MTDINKNADKETLGAHFDALNAERARTWKPENLANNIAQRQKLVENFDASKIVQIGDRVAPFALQDSDGNAITLDGLIANGPAVLIFFRYAGCPACNLALPYYERQLLPGLTVAGVSLAAVSPHLPEQGLGEIGKRHTLNFPVAVDRDNELGRQFGITFARDEVPAGQPTPGWIGELTGTGTAEFPQPAVILIDTDRTVRFVDVSPDWLVRTEAPVILEAVRALTLQAAD